MTGIRVARLALAMIFISAVSASAQTTLYVDGVNGNDSVLRSANSAATPWRTIGRAAWGSTSRTAPNPSQAAQAGDTVQIAAGTYNFSGTINNRWGVVYNPANSGTSSSPITFRAQGTVVLTAPATGSPVIGCFERNYIHWRGPFTLNEASIRITPDTGTVTMSGGVTGCGVDGISVDGDGEPGYTDNHNGVRVEACNGCFVRNSTIFDVRHPNHNLNGSGIMTYDADNTLIENNRIFDVDNAIFIKGVHGPTSQAGTVIRYNLLENCDSCLVLSFSESARVYQNVIRDSEFGIYLYAEGSDPFRHPVNDWVFNNTIDNMSLVCIFAQGPWHQNVRVWNNIATNCGRANSLEANITNNDAVIDWEHNLYYTHSSFALGWNGAFTFATWRSTFGHDSAAPASLTTDPRYANAAADDFRLCTGAGAPHANCTGASPARTLGVDLFDLDRDGSTTDIIPTGAYVTNSETIGPGAGASPPPSTTLSAPTNLRIVPGGLN
jgi:hypothetical protein